MQHTSYSWVHEENIALHKLLVKKILSSSQDSNLGFQTQVRCSYKLSHWISGIGAEDRWHLSIDTVRIPGWIFLGLANSACMVSTEVLCAATS